MAEHTVEQGKEEEKEVKRSYIFDRCNILNIITLRLYKTALY